MIIAKEGEKMAKFICPEGTIQAVAYDVWDLGMQKTNFQNEDGEDIVQHKVKIAWELIETIDEPASEYDGKRYAINKDYTLSLGEKATLRKDIESWRGQSFKENELKGFDVESIIGSNCLLSIVHNTSKKGKVYAKVGNVVKLPKNMTAIVPENKRSLPDWIKKIQAQSVEVNEKYEAAKSDVGSDKEEQIPF